MKTKQKIVGIISALVLMIIGLGTSISAKAIGDDFTIGGYNAGWVILIIGVVVGLLFASKLIKMPQSIGIKPVALIVAVMMVAGLMMVFVETPTPTADVSGLADLTFKVEGATLTTGGTHYPDTEFDESSNLFTVPYIIDKAGGINEAGDNSTYSDDPYLNFTIKADFPADADDNDLAIIYFEVVNPDLYTASDPDNYVLTKTDDKHQALWLDQDAGTNTISGWTSGGIEETLWARLQLDLYVTGLAQASVFKPAVLNIKFHNQANTWSETFQVSIVCVDILVDGETG